MITAQSGVADLIRTTTRVVLNDALTAHRNDYEALSRSVRDVMRSVPGRDPNNKVGGMPLLLG